MLLRTLRNSLAILGICVSVALLYLPVGFIITAVTLDDLDSEVDTQSLGLLLAMTIIALCIGVGCVLALTNSRRNTGVGLLAVGSAISCLLMIYAFWRYATYTSSGFVDVGDIFWFIFAIGLSVVTIVGGLACGLAWLSFRKG